MPIGKHNHQERHFGQVPLVQIPSWAAILNAATYGGDGFDNSAGASPLHDVEDPALDQDAATKLYVDSLAAARDLLTGDSSTFEAGIGDWVTTGAATVTDDTTFAEAWLGGTYHNLKIEPGGVLGEGALVTLDETLRAGRRYAAMVVLKATDAAIISFTGTVDLPVPVLDEYAAFVVYVTPGIDIVSPELRVSSAGSLVAGEVIRVARCVVVRADVLEDTLPALTRIPITGTDDGGEALVLIGGTKLVRGIGAFLRFVSQNVIHLATDNDLVRIEADGDTGQISLWAFGGSGGDLAAEGFDIETGPDGVGIRVVQEDATTLQIFPQTNDANLRDNTGVGVWKTTGANGSAALNSLLVSTVAVVIDGGGSAITTGIKSDITLDFDCSIAGWTLLADQAGDIEVDIWRDAYANFPPDVADSMVGGGTAPAITADDHATGDASDWDTATISAGDTLRFNVASAATLTRATVALKVVRT